MTSGGRRNVAASARARLLNRSRETGEDFQSLLRRYAGERFLYRLEESRHRDRYMLKGGMLLALWGDTIYRPTRDLELLSNLLPRPMTERFRASRPMWGLD